MVIALKPSTATAITYINCCGALIDRIMKKELKDVNVKINAQEFSNWFKKHFKHANEDIMCDMIRIVDMSEIDGSMNDFSKIAGFNEDISNWDAS